MATPEPQSTVPVEPLTAIEGIAVMDGPNTHRMDAPANVTSWTVISTTREVPSDDGRRMESRDEWWHVPTFVVDALDAARSSAPVSVAASSPDPLTALPIALDRLEAYINGAPGDPDDPDFDFTTEDREFIREARYALAALPVREDEPTGIDE